MKHTSHTAYNIRNGNRKHCIVIQLIYPFHRIVRSIENELHPLNSSYCLATIWYWHFILPTESSLSLALMCFTYIHSTSSLIPSKFTFALVLQTHVCYRFDFNSVEENNTRHLLFFGIFTNCGVHFLHQHLHTHTHTGSGAGMSIQLSGLLYYYVCIKDGRHS